MKSKLSHVGAKGMPTMVNVSGKKTSLRTAHAQARVRLGKTIVGEIRNNELVTGKGPVFMTAIVAGVQGAKKTAELIPFCHPLGLDHCQVRITVKGEFAVIDATAELSARTGVEMEVMTAASIAALTIYDMCKALSHDIIIEKIQLMSKTGGKKNFHRS